MTTVHMLAASPALRKSVVERICTKRVEAAVIEEVSPSPVPTYPISPEVFVLSKPVP
jgi:hypothetical protein